MLRYVVVLLLASTLALAASNRRPLNGRIIGGEKTNIEQYPWQVSLEAFGLHNCGGSIIAPDTVLTAAHCIDGLLSLFYQVVAGTSKLSSQDKVTVGIKETIVHEDYRDYGHDVAIIKLNQNLTFSDKISAVKLTDVEPEAGVAVNVSGWGILHDYDIFSPDDLYAVTVNIVDREECKKDYSEFSQLNIDETMICAAVPGGGKDACSGDSGGPLTIGDTLYGVVSWGEGCALADYPGVYTNVANVRDWIKTHSGV